MYEFKKYYKETNKLHIDGNKTYKRIGKCNSSNCKNYCCKLRKSSRGGFKRYINNINNLFFVGRRKLENNQCVFLKDNKCEIHKLRPLPCYAFPSYPEFVDMKLKENNCTFDFVKIVRR